MFYTTTTNPPLANHQQVHMQACNNVSIIIIHQIKSIQKNKGKKDLSRLHHHPGCNGFFPVVIPRCSPLLSLHIRKVIHLH
jgi:hypothetical protein